MQKLESLWHASHARRCRQIERYATDDDASYARRCKQLENQPDAIRIDDGAHCCPLTGRIQFFAFGRLAGFSWSRTVDDVRLEFHEEGKRSKAADRFARPDPEYPWRVAALLEKQLPGSFDRGVVGIVMLYFFPMLAI